MIDSDISTAVLIPVFEPSKRLPELVCDLLYAGFKNIIVVNDGCGDEDGIFASIAMKSGCAVLTDETRFGKGHAIRKGLVYYLENLTHLSGVVIADANYRYKTEAIKKISDDIIANPHDIILGLRSFSHEHIPLRSRLGIKMTRVFFHLCHGIELSDTQTGLRGIPTSLVEEMSKIDGDRFEYETKMLIYCADENIPMDEEPVEVSYKGAEQSDYRAVRDTARIYKSLLKRFSIYTFASASSTFLDMLVFNIVLMLLPASFAEINVLPVVMLNVLIATIVGRAVGTVYNFFINKRLVFKQGGGKNPTGTALWRFAFVNLCQMIASAIFVSTALRVFNLERTGSLVATGFKCIVETILFFVCYKIQRVWVFGGDKKEDDKKEEKDEPLE